jgi:hypothetical protein
VKIRKVLALVLLVSGIAFAGRGLLHWQEPPLPPDRSVNMYVMSRQVEDLESAVVLVVCAALIHWSWRR